MQVSRESQGAVVIVRKGVFTWKQERGFFGDTPIWRFITDQPIPYKALHTLGVDFMPPDAHGVVHVVNHVGSKFWPSPADFIEEGFSWGFSTKVPKTQDLSMLTPASRIIHVHALGALVNPETLGRWVVPAEHAQRCARHRKACFRGPTSVENYLVAKAVEARTISNPAMYTNHVLAPRKAWTNPGDLPGTGCNFYHWAFAQPTFMEAVDENGEVVQQFEEEELLQIWERTHPTRSPSIFRELANTHTLKFFREGNEHDTNRYRVYPIFARTPDHAAPTWVSAMIAALPLTNISVIQARDGNHLETLAKKREEASGFFHVTEQDA